MSVDFLSKNFPPFQVHHAKKPPRFYPDGFQRNVIDFYFIFSDCRLRKALYLQFSYFIWPLCEMDNTSISSFKQQYFSKSSEITDCRFAIRTTTPEGLAFSGNDNYVNKIYTVGSIDDAIQGISFDYQLYFQPPQPEITSKITSFFETSKKCFFEEIFNEEYCGKR